MQASGRRPSDQIEPPLRALLDHVAIELAQEYVRLMEEAATAEARCVERPSMESRGG